MAATWAKGISAPEAGWSALGRFLRATCRHSQHQVSPFAITMSCDRVSMLVGCVLAGFPSDDVASNASRQTVEIADGLSFEPVAISGGSFQKGNIVGSGQRDEQLVRAVEVAGFWVLRTEVTRGLPDRKSQCREAQGWARVAYLRTWACHW
jgi:hypothetical protein